MNITRRTLLKSIGIGTAAAVSGVAVSPISKNRMPKIKLVAGNGVTLEHHDGSITIDTWSDIAGYDLGDKVIGTDGQLFVSKDSV